MATALEKVRELVATISDATDAELREILPGIPPAVVRPMVSLLPRMLPNDNAELDEQLERAHGFIDSLRSDPVAELEA